MTNEEYIIAYREADIRSLALRKVPEGVDALWCLRQIEGYQLARKKLPQWAATEGLWFPPRLSMEQCSSETTAQYKRDIVRRLMPSCDDATLVDLTGGFGVDFCYMAQGFGTAVYVEQQEELCRTATHNMPLLGLRNARVVRGDGTSFLEALDYADIIYIDPARRDTAGRKTVAIDDCTPDVCSLQGELRAKARYTIIKLSPMLDITQALRTLTAVREIHVVSVKGECKELLLVLEGELKNSRDIAPVNDGGVVCHCVNLSTLDAPFVSPWRGVAAGIPVRRSDAPAELLPAGTPLVGMLLFEPNASILKVGVQDAFAARYSLRKLHPMSNLFVCSDEELSSTGKPPARLFRVTAASDFSKASLRALLHGVTKGNLATRNFPQTVAELRKRLKLKEGGDDYFFATTLADGNHVLIKCQALRTPTPITTTF